MVELEEYKQASIESIFEDFVPANKRDWYPWVWPEKEWWDKQSRDRLGEDIKLIKEAREIVKKDLFFFADEILRDPIFPRLQIGLHDELCHIIQKETDCVILMPRNHLKSTLCSEAYPLWKLGINPNIRTLIASATLDEAQTFLDIIKQHINSNERLKFIFPNLKPMKAQYKKGNYEQWNQSEIKTQRDRKIKEPSISVMGALQTKTGMHYDIHIYDDTMTEKNAQTDDTIEKIIRWYETSLNLMDRGGVKIIIGTRYRDNDLYGWLEEHSPLPFYCRKAIENNEYVWTDKLSIDRVKKMERELSSYVFSCQYMNEPIALADQEFKEDWIREWDCDIIRERFVDNPVNDDFELIKQWTGGHNVFLAIDPNRSKVVRKRNDYCVIMAAGMDTAGNIFVYDFYRGKPTSSLDMVQTFCNWFQRWNPVKAKQEMYGGDEHLVDLIKQELKKRELPVSRFSGFKVTRWETPEYKIREMQSHFEQGKVWIGKGKKWHDFKYELLRFPNGKHDDIITALALVVTQMAFKPKVSEQKPTYKGWRRYIRNDKRPKNWLQV